MFLQPNESIKKKSKLLEMQCFGKVNQPTKETQINK